MPAWSGFWNHIYSEPHSLIDSKAVRRTFGQSMMGYGRKAYNASIRQLVTGNLGGTITKDYTRVAVQNVNDPMSLGGKRLTETKTAINRASVQADIDRIVDDLDFDNSPTPWPVDKSGNGGGGKAGL